MRTLLALALAVPLGAGPVRLIFDTDMGNDIDDALALAVIHALESRGEARLLAVTLTKDNPHAAPYCDLVNHFYKRGHIPVAVVKKGVTPEDNPMIAVPVNARGGHGALLYPRRLLSGNDAPDATAFLRGLLEAQPDASVTAVQVGFSTNFARLLQSPGGRELIARKVRLLSVMAGAFPDGKPEYNVKTDLPAAEALFRDWPTPIVASGFEIGLSILYPALSIERDFSYVPHHPVAHAYRSYKPMPYDRPTWDLTSVLYAVRPDRGYFGLSEPGTISTQPGGRTRFTPGAGGRHRYLTVTPEQRVRVLEALVSLASQPPAP
jgi:inosine-uridine nucleoside N-ribohydrolase